MGAELPKLPVEGGCQCGAVRFRMKAMPLAVYACHCKDCQRFSGATHTISMVVQAATVDLIGGELDRFDKPADSGRVIAMMGCKACGTKIWNEPPGNTGMLIMKAGTLDDMSWAEPVGNIWTDSKAPWVVIDPDVPNFAGQPPNRQALIDAYSARLTGSA